MHVLKRLSAPLGAVVVSTAAVPATAQQAEWSKMPRMQLERQFAGPLADTVIQRWRDPADGTVCYLYLPINVPHSAPTQSGYVQYGPASIGSISCMAAGPPAPPPNGAPPRRPPNAGPPPAAPLR
ncbi:hypothetical protein PQJ75_21065 [Rhodoplanes sp. TEM]|uniref:Uncharacterized protein n=1 Tax=Rhodoplanes tepidamans TaxID=200616 RepID=A0ABT5JF88_RHOTP|nr:MULTISPECIES: hypothetical protein [Rhodoplanes]MDC7788291.1 hypothetical protein [Rhodoplanes tepidamans]MDC7986229.1 hypothetical protein [Rhodoplanes sp. TEM]MDQ0355656.1 hypothetical protein [Rhodoplanes tepidamans]